jgi:hypothetical protein
MNKVVLQLWEESTRGKEPAPCGCSIHIDESSKDIFINSIYEGRRDKPVPDTYDRIIGPSIDVFVSESLYKKISELSSIKLEQSEFSNLINFEEIIIKK